MIVVFDDPPGAVVVNQRHHGSEHSTVDHALPARPVDGGQPDRLLLRSQGARRGRAPVHSARELMERGPGAASHSLLLGIAAEIRSSIFRSSKDPPPPPWVVDIAFIVGLVVALAYCIFHAVTELTGRSTVDRIYLGVADPDSVLAIALTVDYVELMSDRTVQGPGLCQSVFPRYTDPTTDCPVYGVSTRCSAADVSIVGVSFPTVASAHRPVPASVEGILCGVEVAAPVEFEIFDPHCSWFHQVGGLRHPGEPVQDHRGHRLDRLRGEPTFAKTGRGSGDRRGHRSRCPHPSVGCS